MTSNYIYIVNLWSKAMHVSGMTVRPGDQPAPVTDRHSQEYMKYQHFYCHVVIRSVCIAPLSTAMAYWSGYLPITSSDYCTCILCLTFILITSAKLVL
jgi:hypothetical protein